MKCRVCGQRAFYTPSWVQRGGYCREHYVERFRRRVLRYLEKAFHKYRPRLILAAVSGGKDSVAMLDTLVYASSRLGFRIVGLTIDLGIRGYSEVAVKTAIRAYNELGVEYVIVSLDELLDFVIDDVAFWHSIGYLARPTCSLCGVFKRAVLEYYARIIGADAIATGHTMDDVVGFEAASSKEFAILERGELVYRLRPLLVVNDADTLAYVRARGLPYTETPCPHKPRESMQALERFLYEYLRSRYPSKSYTPRYFVEKPSVQGRCIYCGRPSAGEVCNACWYEATLQNWRIQRAARHSV